MGLFCLPKKPIEECTSVDLIKSAIDNLVLWQSNQTCDYLLYMAVSLLQDARDKLQCDE